MPIHEDQRYAHVATLRSFNTAVKLGLADATIAALTTGVAGLQAAIRAVPGHEDQLYPKVRIAKAMKVAKDLGTLTDTNVNAVTAGTAVAQMQALWTTADAWITNPTMYGNILWGE